MKPLLPENEAERLATLDQLRILDTPKDPAFEAITALACLICNTPSAAISFVAKERLWCKSSANLKDFELNRSQSCCAYAILAPDQVMTIADLSLDPRFATPPTPLVEQGFRFYAGAPLRLSDQVALGTVCVLDTKPRQLTTEQLMALQLLAEQTVTLIKSRLLEFNNEEQQQKIRLESLRLEAIIQGTNLGTWEWHVQKDECFFNNRWLALLGASLPQPASVLQWRALIHPDDLQATEQKLLQHFAEQQPFFDARFRMRSAKGDWCWVHAAGKVTKRHQGQPVLMFGTMSDISEDVAKEQEMQSTRSWLQAMIDSSSEVAMISTDTHGVIQLFNTGAERMLGYSAAELVGLQTPVLFHCEDEVACRAIQLSEEYQQPISGFDTFVFRARQGINDTRQWTYVCKNGERKQVRLSVSVIQNKQGVVLGYLGVAIDITQLEQLHHALLLSEQRYRSMLENLPGVVYRCINDEYWTMLFISDEVEKLTGYPAKNFVRNKLTTFAGITHPEDTVRNRSIVEQELEKHARFSVEYRITHANGQVRWVQELGRGIFDEQNRLLFIDGFIWDITAQKEAALQLNASEKKLSSLYQMAPIAIVLSQYHDGTFVDANPEFEQMLGYGAEQIPQLSFDQLLLQRQDAELLQHMQQLHLTGRYGPFETEFVHQNGEFVPVVINGVLIENSQGQLQTWSIIQDIRERKRIEQMKSQFVSMVSHELRTPLTAISGALGLISGGALGAIPSTMTNMLTIAHDNSLKLTQLINDLLDIDKLVAGKMQFEFRQYQLSELLQQSILQNQTYATKYQTRITLQIQHDVTVELDQLRFQQIMANLLSNAAKFSPAGADIQVRLSQHQGFALIEVQDHGPGIPASFQQRMFEKFSQADSADARSRDGTGLGLAIVKELTDRMSGDISFTTSAQTGTCFTLRFPAVGSCADSENPPLPQPHVLVVEDDQSTADFIATLLNSEGYQVTLAPDLQSARQALKRQQYSALTLDLHLPDGFAAKFIQELRDDPKTSTIPVLIVSIEQYQQELKFCGFNAFDWVEKPISAATLLGKLNQLMASKQSRVLHIEDDPLFAQLLSQLTAKDINLTQAATVAAARLLLEQQQYDLVILDLGLPDGSGWELLPLISRQHQHLPVLIWSATEVTPELTSKVTAVLSKQHQAIPQLLATMALLLQIDKT